MDFVVAWSPQVRDDLNAIAAYIAKGSPRYASAVIQEILAAGRSLTHFPLRGRVVPELDLADYREIFVHEYRLIYHVDGQAVQILAVIHGRRLLDAITARLGKK